MVIALSVPDQFYYILIYFCNSHESYEPRAFEHGFMTYSLLRGLQSPGLYTYGKDDYIDVPKLFKFALIDAPKVAASVQRDQSPIFRSPSQQEGAFYIGLMSDSLKATIQLQQGAKRQLNACEIDDGKGAPPRIKVQAK